MMRVQCKCTRDNAGWGGRLDRTAVRALRLANPNAARVLHVEVGCERRRLNGITSSEDAIARIHSVADAERRKQWVRETFLSLIGGLPDYTGPLNARTTGRIQAENYSIEKIIFESLPGFYVTANLYRPDQAGRYPGILLQAGHTQEGKPEGQRLAANLALKGFVVLAFDPVGQGEREQTYDPRVDRPLAGWSVPEHIQAGAQSILIGESVARYFIWDAKRALDYLVSRPEVDAARLGAVGCSGGGAVTTFIGALDSRIKAVAPANVAQPSQRGVSCSP